MSTTIKRLIAGLQEGLTADGLNKRSDITQGLVSLEQLDQDARVLAATGLKDVQAVVATTISEVGLEEFGMTKPTDAQYAAANLIVGMALDPRAATASRSSLKQPDVDKAVVISASSIGVEDIITGNGISMEAFDGQSINSAVYFSVVYNLLAARQDEFGERWYPTITIDPTASGANVEARVISLYNDFTRSTSGTPDKNKFNKVSVVKVITDSKLLSADKNRLIPVLRTGVNDDILVGALSYVAENGEDKITTAPIAIGTNISLLGVSQTDAMLSKGVMDNTDALDRRVQLKDVYYKLTGDNAGTPFYEYFKFDISSIPHSNFTHSTQGKNKELSLAFETDNFILKTGGLMSDGNASTILAGLATNHTLKIKLVLHGDGDTENGDIVVYASKFVLGDVLDASGKIIDPAGATYTAIKAALAAMEVTGYTVDAWSTNSNLRTRGQLIGVDVYNQVYTVPIRTGITILKTLTNSNDADNDAVYLASQITFAGIKTSLEAVETLVAFGDTLKQLTDNGTLTDGIEIMGMGRFFVDAYYSDANLDLATAVDSLKSGDRLDDIQSAIVNKVRDEAILMATGSNYAIASKVLNGGIDKKITVNVGTDTRIAQYLKNDLTKLALGDMFDVKVVSTANPLMTNRIYISFSVDDANRNTVPNPLNFGQMFWSPEISVDVIKNGGGSAVRELTTMPRFLHVNNLPILSIINVTNIASVLAKVTQNTKTV